MTWKRLLWFTALGACALSITLWWQAANHERKYDPIHITLAQLQQAESNWRARWGRSPDERDREITLRNETNEEVLFREALQVGLHCTDPVVKRRLWQNMQFLALDEQAETGTDLLDRAYALDMHKSDIVVRRRLVQRFHRNLFDAASPTEPSRAKLVAHLDSDPGAFQSIPRLSFVQLYVTAHNGDEPPPRALALLTQLQIPPPQSLWATHSRCSGSTATQRR